MNHYFRDSKGVNTVSGRGHINNIPNAADAKTDLGYGTLKAKFHNPRAYYQYDYEASPAEDTEAADEIDDETYEAVLSRLSTYNPGDPYAKNKVDPFTFAGAATKLSETSTSKGMVPFPRMYQGRQAVAGGTAPVYPQGPTDGFSSRIRPTGTKLGFSKPPYPQFEEEDYDPLSLSDIMEKDLDEDHLNDILRKTRKVTSQNRR